MATVGNDINRIKQMMQAYVEPMLHQFTDDDLREFRTFVTDAINDEFVKRRLAVARAKDGCST